MKKYITKRKKDICLGDVKLVKDCISWFLQIEMFQDYDGTEINSDSVRVMPGHAISGGCHYMFHDKDDSTISNFLQPEDAKKARIAFAQYKKNVKHLFDLYVNPQNRKNKETIPLYYVDDKHLNVDLKEGDVIYTLNKYYGVIYTVLRDNDYHKCTEGIEQDELFHDWLIETGKDYSVRLYGYSFRIGNDDKTLLQVNSSDTYYLSAKPADTYLVRGMTMDWLSDRMINITKKLYDELYDIYKEYSNDEPTVRTIGHVNGKNYSSWEVPEDVIQCNDNEYKINRIEA